MILDLPCDLIRILDLFKNCLFNTQNASFISVSLTIYVRFQESTYWMPKCYQLAKLVDTTVCKILGHHHILQDIYCLPGFICYCNPAV